MHPALDSFDDAVDAAVDRVRGTPGVDHAFYAASAGGEFGLVWLVVGALTSIGRRGGRRRFTRLAIAMGLESALVNGGVKSLFRRTRPAPHFDRPLPLRIPITTSFPSGHASSAAAAATILSDGETRRGLKVLYWALAALVAGSRVYVKIHHASDVVGGLVIGRLFGLAVVKVAPLPADRADDAPA